jgi:predicted phosphoribosyltransferase
VARAIAAPLDLLLARKLGVPGQRELAMGAIAEGGAQALNQDVVEAIGVGPGPIAQVAAAEEREIARQAAAYREGRRPPELRGRTVILVDDGLATGATMRAAIAAARAGGAARLIVATPVAAPDTVALLRPLVDEIVAVETPEPFGAIGMWYDDFGQVSDDEVRALLRRAAPRPERFSFQ